MLIASCTFAAAAAVPSAGAAITAPRAILAQSGGAPSLTPTPQRGTKKRSQRPARSKPATAPARPPTQLPYTGGEMWLVFLAGIALLLSGIGLRLRAARWRRIPRC